MWSWHPEFGQISTDPHCNSYVAFPRACLDSGLVLMRSQDGIYFTHISANITKNVLMHVISKVNTQGLLFALCLLGIAYTTFKSTCQKMKINNNKKRNTFFDY